MAAAIPRRYPVRFDVDYPDHRLNRLTTAFRPIVAIPIVIVMSARAYRQATSGWRPTNVLSTVGAR